MNDEARTFAKVIAGCLGALVLFVAFAILLFFYSTGTAYVQMTVDTRVLDRETERPVRDCVLTFERGQAFGAPTTRGRTDATGRARLDAGEYSYVGSKAAAFQNDHSPELRLYLGERPRPGVSDEAESWMVRLTFKQPWLAPEVTPVVVVERSRARSDPSEAKAEGGLPPLRFDPLPTATGASLAHATIRFGTARRRTTYEIALTLRLDSSQIAACQAEASSGR